MSTETTEAQKEQVLQQQTSESNESSSASTQQTQPKLEGEALDEALKKQIEYYFSKQNLLTDRYLVSQMNSDFFVPIKTIANFKMIKSLTTDVDLVVNIMKQCKTVELDETATLVRPYLQPTKNTIILREVAPNTTEQEVRDLFNHEQCGKIQEIRSEIGDYWYIVFENDQDALKSLEFISGKTFKEAPIKARLKFENTFRNILASTVMAATTPQAVPAVGYAYAPGYATYPPGQRQRDGSYGRGYDKRGGHRGTGNRRRDYNKEGQKDGNRSEGQRRYTKGGSLKTEPQQQRRKRSEGASTAPPLGPANFPPLSPASDKQFGYEGIFQKYSKQEMIDIIKGVSDTSKPEDMPADCKAVAQAANLELEVTKPFPNRSAEAVKKPVETVWKANASVPAAVITPPPKSQPKQATSPQPPTKQDTQPKQAPTNTNTNNKGNSNPKPKSKGNRSRSSSKNQEKPADHSHVNTPTAEPAKVTEPSTTAPAATPAAATQLESTQ